MCLWSVELVFRGLFLCLLAVSFSMFPLPPATLRSGYMLRNTVDFSKSVEEMMRQTLGISVDEPVEEEPELEETEDDEEQLLEDDDEDEDEDGGEVEEMHDEL